MLITQPWALYNEIDEYAAEWIENLIRLGQIAPGIVDRRSIVDICPDELRGFRQVHFFAGIGVWSYAFRRAGVSDDTALWSGSCPCQPFSAAGKGVGVDDERHLWPAFFHHIQSRRPPRIYGEQVASKDGLGWLDIVCADLEASDYSVWAVDTPSAGSGGPHIRQRLRFCADDIRSAAGGLAHLDDAGLERWWQPGRERASQRLVGQGGLVGWMADLHGGDSGSEWQQRGGQQRQFSQDCGVGELGDSDCSERQARSGDGMEGGEPTATSSRLSCIHNRLPRPTNGFWGDADWLFCRDGKWRPVEPFTFPLVNGTAFHLGSGSAFEGKSRQGMLRAYGNAVDAEATTDFIEATIDVVGDDPDDLL